MKPREPRIEEPMQPALRAAVYTAAGVPIGQIARIVLDARTGRVAYAVLRCGDQHGAPLMEIPQETLRFDRRQGRFVLAAGTS